MNHPRILIAEETLSAICPGICASRKVPNIGEINPVTDIKVWNVAIQADLY
jgi:hypothetical protein